MPCVALAGRESTTRCVAAAWTPAGGVMQRQIEQFVATLNQELANHTPRSDRKPQNSLIPVIELRAPDPQKPGRRPRRRT